MICLERRVSLRAKGSRPQGTELFFGVHGEASLGTAAGEGNTRLSRASCGLYRLRDPPGMQERGRQNKVRCDICKTLPLITLFDESSNALFIFLSPGKRGRLQKPLVFCRSGIRRSARIPLQGGLDNFLRQFLLFVYTHIWSPAKNMFFCFQNLGL